MGSIVKSILTIITQVKPDNSEIDRDVLRSSIEKFARSYLKTSQTVGDPSVNMLNEVFINMFSYRTVVYDPLDRYLEGQNEEGDPCNLFIPTKELIHMINDCENFFCDKFEAPISGRLHQEFQKIIQIEFDQLGKTIEDIQSRSQT